MTEETINAVPTDEEILAAVETIPAPTPPTLSQKVVVWFNFQKGEFRDQSRVVLNGVVNIRTQAELENVEHLIRTQLGHDRVFVTNWKQLEA